MGYSLDQFADSCHRILTEDPGPGGRNKVCALVQDVLQDEAFVARHLGDDVPERKILYEDPKLGFCILAHVYNGAKESQPHDHGPSWAIYGQAAGETMMTDWDCVARPTDGAPGKAVANRDYIMKPGDAYLYDVGVLHSPERKGDTRLLRIEGLNMAKVTRFPYEAVTLNQAAE